MATTVLKRTENSNNLPDDIFIYNHEEFYGFVRETRGVDIAELFSFQAIRHASHLMDTTCDEILLVLQEDSEDINNLKKLCCFQLSDNKFRVKLGVKLAINNLIQSLKIKQEQHKQQKKKRSSKQGSSSNVDNKISANGTSLQDEITSLESTSSVATAIVDTLSTQPEIQQAKRNLDEIGHVADINERLNQWWISTIKDGNVFLEEGVHYSLQVNKSVNDNYACILSCLCHTRFKLSFMPSGCFKLSSFCRHIKEKKCFQQYLKRKNGRENILVDNQNSTIVQSNTSDNLSNTESKKSKNLPNTYSKRVRTPSMETPLNTQTTVKRKSRRLSSNSTNSSPEKKVRDDNEN